MLKCQIQSNSFLFILKKSLEWGYQVLKVCNSYLFFMEYYILILLSLVCRCVWVIVLKVASTLYLWLFRFGLISGQQFADPLFDMAVNSGRSQIDLVAKSTSTQLKCFRVHDRNSTRKSGDITLGLRGYHYASGRKHLQNDVTFRGSLAWVPHRSGLVPQWLGGVFVYAQYSPI